MLKVLMPDLEPQPTKRSRPLIMLKHLRVPQLMLVLMVSLVISPQRVMVRKPRMVLTLHPPQSIPMAESMLIQLKTPL